jgi:MFS superfamily sulfate permease-like transporter
MMSSLFNGMPAAGGLTRTLIVETTGAKTQMFSIVSSAFVLIVIVGLGFLFRYLPYVIDL